LKRGQGITTLAIADVQYLTAILVSDNGQVFLLAFSIFPLMADVDFIDADDAHLFEANVTVFTLPVIHFQRFDRIIIDVLLFADGAQRHMAAQLDERASQGAGDAGLGVREEVKHLVAQPLALVA